MFFSVVSSIRSKMMANYFNKTLMLSIHVYNHQDNAMCGLEVVFAGRPCINVVRRIDCTGETRVSVIDIHMLYCCKY